MAKSDKNIRISEALSNLPEKPGVYRFFDSNRKVLYVGKAKNLKKRVSSYFNKTQENRKTNNLVSQIGNIEYTLVDTEFDAFLLENNLIKEHQPKYNILLRDDKSYPFICIIDEEFPRVISTRRIEKKEGAYFGPYASVSAMNTLLEFIHKHANIRTCSLKLSPENISGKKFKVCLEYHLGNCLGPCEGLQSNEEYHESISEVKSILCGEIKPLRKQLENAMLKKAAAYEFEKAQRIKQKLYGLQRFQNKSLIVNPKLKNIDVYTSTSTDDTLFINYLHIENGYITRSENHQLSKKLNETEAEIFGIFLFNQIYNSAVKSDIIISNTKVELGEDLPSVSIPRTGEKKKLIQLSLKNALESRKNFTSNDKSNPKNKNSELLLRAQKDLNLKQPPLRIECFDNSNLQGSNPVASMVCFINGKPSKKEYRQFIIKTVIGPDDFSSMREVVFRRYRRVLEEKKPLPNLVIIDGGKGQLSAAYSALEELKLHGVIPIISIAKRLEEIYFPNDEFPIYINKKSTTLRLIQQLRNEAHRFAITFHRNRRSKYAVKSNLTNIPGFGQSTVRKIIQHYKATSKIVEGGESQLHKLIGKKKAKLLWDLLTKKGA